MLQADLVDDQQLKKSHYKSLDTPKPRKGKLKKTFLGRKNG